MCADGSKSRGGISGALLLRYTPPSIFDAIVPFLILFATILFMVQETVQRFFKTARRAINRHAGWRARSSFNSSYRCTEDISERE